MTAATIHDMPWAGDIRALTFDCYGTLIDWESGILSALGVYFDGHGIPPAPAEWLALYARFEPEEQAGAYRSYREVLAGVLRRMASHYRTPVARSERDLLADTLADWRPFPDTVAALERLHERYALAVVSNIDDDLFAGTRRHLPDVFAEVVTAQQVRSYKPAHAHFHEVAARLRVGAKAILHVAESLFHDIQPARQLGWHSVWVNRRSKTMAVGATRGSDARPDVTVSSLSELAGQLAPATGAAMVCPVCGSALVAEKCKVVCRSSACVYRIVMNCAEC